MLTIYVGNMCPSEVDTLNFNHQNILVDNVDIYEENTGGDNEYDVDYDDINSDKFGDSCYYVGKGGVDDVEIGDVIEDNKGDDSVGDE